WLEKASITKEKIINLKGMYFYQITVNPTKREKENRKIIPFI
ncbi:hypothetical protein LCGC14_2578880, partial [marine sediment metagenome]